METDAFITPVANDEDSIDIDINSTKPLSDIEKTAVEHFRQAVIHDKEIIRSLPDGQRIKMYDVSIITKEDLLSRHLRIDIRIDPDDYKWDNVHTGYKNGTDRGESVYTPDGDLSLHFMMKTIVGYDSQGGLNFLIAHELGHSTVQGQAYNGGPDQETYANDVAWAISGWAGEPRYERFLESHYSNTAPEFLGFAIGPVGDNGPRNPGSHTPDPDGNPPPFVSYSVTSSDGGEQYNSDGSSAAIGSTLGPLVDTIPVIV